MTPTIRQPYPLFRTSIPEAEPRQPTVASDDAYSPLDGWAYKDSYLWRLRQAVGSNLVLMPGAMVAVQREDQRVLLTKRADDGTWCLPAGAAEPGGSFARTAIDELAEGGRGRSG